jgi:UDP-N-acetylglucosamine:LPS N-acetylglucosamine transferase
MSVIASTATMARLPARAPALTAAQGRLSLTSSSSPILVAMITRMSGRAANGENVGALAVSEVYVRASSAPGSCTWSADGVTFAAADTLGDRIGAPRVLILYAGVGHGHRVAAEGVAAELREALPGAHVALRDGLGAPWGAQRLVLEHLIRWQLRRWPHSYHLAYTLAVRWAPGRRAALALLSASSRRRLLALVSSEAPDAILSTYPGLTAPLGRLRQSEQLGVPVCALITDLASLHFWAHPGIDLHLAAYEQSLQEIAAIAGSSPARVVRPPLRTAHLRPRGRSQARRALHLKLDSPVILISGGGWGIGDLHGAVQGALAVVGTQVLVVCGQNGAAATRLTRAYEGNVRVRVLGYTDAMPDLLRAADALVHSTGGLTCLEAAAHGCPVIAYGFSYGHVRHNVAAMVRVGVASSARDPGELAAHLRAALAQPPPTFDLNGKPTAASAILALIGAGDQTAANATAASPSEPRGGG